MGSVSVRREGGIHATPLWSEMTVTAQVSGRRSEMSRLTVG